MQPSGCGGVLSSIESVGGTLPRPAEHLRTSAKRCGSVVVVHFITLVKCHLRIWLGSHQAFPKHLVVLCWRNAIPVREVETGRDPRPVRCPVLPLDDPALFQPPRPPSPP